MKALLMAASLSLIGLSAASAQTPYAGMQARSVKALSDQQVGDLREGRGMGLALAAELNGYPGPAHLLELADKLDLTAEQRSRVRELFTAMKEEAVPIGNRLLEQETKLDDQFADRTVDDESLKQSILEIALTQGELRATHLKYHLSARSVLSDEQLGKYAELRGYKGGSMPAHRHPH
jgi:Spy/CpxP family protein refolding chaperone